MREKQEIKTNKFSGHRKLTMAGVLIMKIHFSFYFREGSRWNSMKRRVPEENIWWIFVEKEEESDSEDSEDWHFSESESADSEDTSNPTRLFLLY